MSDSIKFTRHHLQTLSCNNMYQLKSGKVLSAEHELFVAYEIRQQERVIGQQELLEHLGDVCKERNGEGGYMAFIKNR